MLVETGQCTGGFLVSETAADDQAGSPAETNGVVDKIVRCFPVNQFWRACLFPDSFGKQLLLVVLLRLSLVGAFGIR